MISKQHLVLTIPFLLKACFPWAFWPHALLAVLLPVRSPQSPLWAPIPQPSLGYWYPGSLALSLLSLFFFLVWYVPTLEDLVHSLLCCYHVSDLIISNLMSISGLEPQMYIQLPARSMYLDAHQHLKVSMPQTEPINQPSPEPASPPLVFCISVNGTIIHILL